MPEQAMGDATPLAQMLAPNVHLDYGYVGWVEDPVGKVCADHKQ